MAATLADLTRTGMAERRRNRAHPPAMPANDNPPHGRRA